MAATASTPPSAPDAHLPIWVMSPVLESLQERMVKDMQYDVRDVRPLAVIAAFIRNIVETAHHPTAPPPSSSSPHASRQAAATTTTATKADPLGDANGAGVVHMEQTAAVATAPASASVPALHAPGPSPWIVHGPKFERGLNHYDVSCELQYNHEAATAAALNKSLMMAAMSHLSSAGDYAQLPGATASSAFSWAISPDLLRRIQCLNRMLPNEPIQLTWLESKKGRIHVTARVLSAKNCAPLPPDTYNLLPNTSAHQLPEQEAPQILVHKGEIGGLCDILKRYVTVQSGRGVLFAQGMLGHALTVKDTDMALVACALRCLQIVVLRNRASSGGQDAVANVDGDDDNTETLLMGNGGGGGGGGGDAVCGGATQTDGERAFERMLVMSSVAGTVSEDDLESRLARDELRCCVARNEESYTVSVVAQSMVLTWDDERDMCATTEAWGGRLWIRMHQLGAASYAGATKGGFMALSVCVPMLQYIAVNEIACDGPPDGMHTLPHSRASAASCRRCVMRACLSRQIGDKFTMMTHKSEIPLRRVIAEDDDKTSEMIVRYRRLLFPEFVWNEPMGASGVYRADAKEGPNPRRNERRRRHGGDGGGNGGGGGGGGGGGSSSKRKEQEEKRIWTRSRSRSQSNSRE